MTTFFQAQMDYIFFFYGLAFIGLGVVAYILAKEVNQRLPWGWLALFGFTHGAQRVVGPGGPGLGGRGVVWGPALGHHDRVFPLPGGIRPSQPDPKAGPGAGALALGRFGPGRRPGGPGWLERLERHHPLFPGPGGQPGGRVGALRRSPPGRFKVPPLAAGRRRRFHPLRPGHRRGGPPGRVLSGQYAKLRDLHQPHGPADPAGAGPAGGVDRRHECGLFSGGAIRGR